LSKNQEENEEYEYNESDEVFNTLQCTISTELTLEGCNFSYPSVLKENYDEFRFAGEGESQGAFSKESSTKPPP